MKKLLLLLMFFTLNNLFSQQRIELKKVYIDNDLVYIDSNEELFTGIAHKTRKNGHLVYEEKYEKGIIQWSKLYFNGKEKLVSNKTIYNPNKPLVLSKKYTYNLKGEVFEITTFNNDGVRILVEKFENGKRKYSCQYLGKKKNGLEFGYGEDGIKIICQAEYKNNKKIK